MAKITITVSGPIGSGKSIIVRWLIKAILPHFHEVTTFNNLTTIREPHPESLFPHRTTEISIIEQQKGE